MKDVSQNEDRNDDIPGDDGQESRLDETPLSPNFESIRYIKENLRVHTESPHWNLIVSLNMKRMINQKMKPIKVELTTTFVHLKK